VRYENFTVNSERQSVPVFRAGATWQAMEATYLRASYGQGFRFPTIGERFITTNIGDLRIYPNPDLRPESSWNMEAGLKQGFRIGSFEGYLDVVAFQQEYDQYIEFTFGQWAAPTLTNFGGAGFRSVNTGTARVRGIETEIVGRARAGTVDLTFLAGYTMTRPVSTSPDLIYATPYSPNAPSSTYTNTSYDTTDNVLKYRVERLLRADVQAEVGRFSWGVSVRYNSHVRNIDKVFVSLDENGSLPTGVGEWMRTHTTGDWLLDLRAGVRVGDHQRIAFIVNNVTNVAYAIRPLAVEPMRNYQVQFTYTH
jgi:iron complex outermembrane receptor protein